MIADEIEKKLKEALNPEFLKVIDESHKHAAHYEEARKGETHFLIKIRASFLEDRTTLQKHKKIYTLLAKELQEIHALSIHFELTK